MSERDSAVTTPDDEADGEIRAYYETIRGSPHLVLEGASEDAWIAMGVETTKLPHEWQ